MKTRLIISIISIFSFAGYFSSCNYLDVENVLSQTETMDSLFSKKEGVEKLLANVYSYIPNNVAGMIYDIVWTGASDELDMPFKNSSSKAVKLGQNGPDSYIANGWINYWTFAYRAIRAANVFMANVENCPDTRISKAKLTEYKNEARFLRAYYYFLLLQQYGPLIIVPNEPIDLDTPSDKLPDTRSPFDECVAYIETELIACIDLLPKEYEQDNDFGRPTQGAAMALKSRLLLYAASPLFNGNKDYSDFVRKSDGVQLINQTANPDKWKYAADAAKDVITLAEEGIYELNVVPADEDTPVLPFNNTEGDYPNGPGGIDAFRSYKEMFCGNPAENWITKEIIWARPSTDHNYFARHVTPVGLGKDDWGGMGVSQSLVDAFGMSDGRTTEQAYKDGDYKETLEQSSSNGYYTTSGTNVRYLNREPRFYVTVSFQNSRWKNYSGASKPWYNIDFMGADSKNFDAYSPTGVMLRKFVDPELECRADGTRQRGAILIRLAEIYLNYVEALNEYDPGNADIKKYLNRIRYRAGIKGYTSTELGDQNKVRELIRHERRIELCFEMHRYFDSRRWKEAEFTTKDFWGNCKGQGGDQYGMNMGAKTPVEFFKRTLIEKRFFSKRSYLWPIPTAELTKNPKLDQNPDW